MPRVSATMTAVSRVLVRGEQKTFTIDVSVCASCRFSSSLHKIQLECLQNFYQQYQKAMHCVWEVARTDLALYF